MEPLNDIFRKRSIYEQPYKKQAIIAAKELGYGKDVLDKINKAKSETEIARIMATAREEKFG